MLTLKNVRKIYGTRRILEQVSFSIGEGQKVALVGPNGVGKSTLLRLIAGLETQDKGTIETPNRALVGYLHQEVPGRADETLLGYLRRLAGLEAIEERRRVLEAHLEDKERLEEYEKLEQDYRRLGGYNFVSKAKAMLDGLRLSHVDLARPVLSLSGGEKRKAALVGVLLRGVDILLLDEPTNNLDLPALLWLENYLKRSPATLVVASHDRRFLDNVVEKVIEIDWQKRNVVMYQGGWSAYAEMKAHRQRKQKELYRLQEEEKTRLVVSAEEKKDWVDRTMARPRRDRDKAAAHFKKERAAKKFHASFRSLEARMKKLDKVEKPFEKTPLEFGLGETQANNEKPFMELAEVTYGYPDGVAYGPLHLHIASGRRLVFLGSNGAGKTTLLKVMTGELEPLSGEVRRSAHVKIGNLLQEHEDISREWTPYELFDRRADLRDRERIQLLLSQFQFSPDMAATKIKDFSPGERVRLILALLAELDTTVLVLDEPTNHLDLEAIEALEHALEQYPGTLLLVTHDREFLKNVRIDDYYLVSGGTVAPIADYDAYVQGLASQSR